MTLILTSTLRFSSVSVEATWKAWVPVKALGCRHAMGIFPRGERGEERRREGGEGRGGVMKSPNSLNRNLHLVYMFKQWTNAPRKRMFLFTKISRMCVLFTTTNREY